MKNSRKQINKNKKKFKCYDTKIGTVEKELDIDMGVRSDMHFGTFLRSKGYNPLADMLKT